MSEQTEVAADQPVTGPRRWLRSVGPGLVTACVVIGPGSILTSSKVGATHGYAMSWVVIVSVLCMMVYMTLGAKLGVVTGMSAGDLVTREAGRWLAALIGTGAFFMSAAWQFGNNLGVHSALGAYVDGNYWIILFNAVAIAFLFSFKDLYKALERLMSVFVGLMLLAFLINLCFARPNLGELASGFIPRAEIKSADDVLPLLGLVGTTFVITAAFYQSYLVRFKGWKLDQLKNGLVDARVGSVLMAVITLMIMSNAAAVFYGKIDGNALGHVNDVAAQLESAFGRKGRALFCIGLFSAAYSSFLVNSMIGGFIMADGLGLGDKPNELWPRIFTVGVLLTGMCVALVNIVKDWNPVPAIVAAQAVTVLAAPLLAGTLWWLTGHRKVMGDNRNGTAMNLAAGIGFVLLLGMAYRLVSTEIPKKIDALRADAASTAPEEDAEPES